MTETSDRPAERAPAGGTMVLIPACNESARLGPVLRSVRAAIPAARIVVVDDGSRDDTATLAAGLGATVLRHPFNLGYGAALQTGYLYARRHHCSELVQLDADGQHDPTAIPRLLETLRAGADLVIGSRYLREGDAPRTTSLRRLGSRFFAWLVSRWTRTTVTDPTSGFQAMNHAVLERFVLDDFPEDHPDADVLIAVWRHGLRIAEVPVRMHERKGGVSMHRGGRVAFYVYKMVIRLTMLPIRRASAFRDGRVLAARGHA